MSEIDTDALGQAYEAALTLEKAGRYDEAAEAYRRVLAHRPR